jgi:alanine dehydrogenase
MGVKDALESDAYLMEGLNIHAGKLTYEAVATAQGRDFTPAADALTG